MRVQKVTHLFSQLTNAPVERLSEPLLKEHNIRLDIKRDDLLHPIISGNKWRKLKHVLLKIESQGCRSIATMGGRYSNLLHAVSYIAMQLGWKAKLYVRGYQQQQLTPMLQDAKRWGAEICYVDKVTFREIRREPPQLDEGDFWLPEGGYEQLAIKGTIESVMELPRVYDYLVIASATGTSLAGYCQAVTNMQLKTRIIGIATLNNQSEILHNVAQISDGQAVPEVIKGYEFGGFAKSTTELKSFIHHFQEKHNIPLEPVYSGKSFFAVMDLLKKGYFPDGSRVLLVHCGGLQGKRQ